MNGLDLEMKVKKRQKTEVSGDVTYQVFLISEDGKARFSVKGPDISLFEQFKKGETVPVKIGSSPQKTIA